MTMYKFILFRRPVVFLSVIVILYSLIITSLYRPVELKQQARLEDTVTRVDTKHGKLRIWTKNVCATNVSNLKNIELGDIILLEGNFEDVLCLKNPSYGKYLRSQQITYAIDKPTVYLTGKRSQWCYLRGKILNYLDCKIDIKFRNRAYLWKALLYGDKSELPDEVTDSFSKLGISHLLAISGFHVGIIALFFHLILFKISMKSRNLLICVFLIAYAYMTGARASIIRAVGFYLLYYLSFLIRRKYDLLAAVSFLITVILIHNPWKIWDIGFQLSFASVISIGIFYPKLHRTIGQFLTWNPTNKVWEYGKVMVGYMISLIEVTVAAQLLTLPLCIYYFHQIPIYGIIANLVAIPMITIGMILFLVAFFLPNGFFVEYYVIELCNKGMDYLLYWIHQLTALPFSNLKASEFSPYWLILIYTPVVIWYLYEEQNTVRKNFYDIQRTKKQSSYS